MFADALYCEKLCSVLFCCGLIPVGPQPSARSSHTTAQCAAAAAAHSSSPKISSPHSVMLPSGSTTGQAISSLFGLLCLLMCRHVAIGQNSGIVNVYRSRIYLFIHFLESIDLQLETEDVYLYVFSECVLFIGYMG